MRYIKRAMESTVLSASRMFPAVLVTGARQVGKTTLLKHIAHGIPYLTLDDPLLLQSAREDVGSFFQAAPPPVFVDEIQYAPNLFPYIKMIADRSGEKGLFYLTGSQQFRMMKNVGESLAGRIGIVNLAGLSLREISEDHFNRPFIPTGTYFEERKNTAAGIGYKAIWDIIHKGSMPAMHAGDIDWQLFYSAYARTYIERDVRDLTQVGDTLKFIKFMALMAGRTAQLLNLTAVAGEVGISVPTADRWLSVLVASNIVYLLQPFYRNVTKRAVKTPKLYFLDTGLAAYLTKWNSPEVLEAGAMAGVFFETFVIAEVLKTYYNTGVIEPPLYYYRDHDMREIDLIVEQNGALHPIGIKKTSNPGREHIGSFAALAKLSGLQAGPGGVICLCDRCVPIDRDNMAIPVNYI